MEDERVVFVTVSAEANVFAELTAPKERYNLEWLVGAGVCVIYQ
jgi:hypothetical protein